MIKLNQPKVLATSQEIGEPEIHISGDSVSGTRSMLVLFPVFNEVGERIYTITQTYEDGAFNEVFSNHFNSDRDLAEKVMQDQGLSVDVEEMPENLVNVEPEVIENKPVDNSEGEVVA